MVIMYYILHQLLKYIQNLSLHPKNIKTFDFIFSEPLELLNPYTDHAHRKSVYI